MGGGRGIGGVLEGLEWESFSGVDRGVRPLAELRQGWYRGRYIFVVGTHVVLKGKAPIYIITFLKEQLVKTTLRTHHTYLVL